MSLSSSLCIDINQMIVQCNDSANGERVIRRDVKILKQGMTGSIIIAPDRDALNFLLLTE